MNAKERIIRASMDLIRESSGNIDQITIRAIAEKAGVGIGSVNYHFQNKENLITLCVQRMIGEVISNYRPAEGQERNLAANVKAVADFLAENPALSQFSILGDHYAPQKSDNTMKTVQGFSTFLPENNIPDSEKKLRIFTLVSVVQALFLRREMSGEIFGSDFRDKHQRDWLLDRIIQWLFQEHEKNE